MCRAVRRRFTSPVAPHYIMEKAEYVYLAKKVSYPVEKEKVAAGEAR